MMGFINRLLLTLLFLTGLFLITTTTSYAAVRTWDGGGTDGTCGGNAGDGNKWSCAANWSSDTIPGSSDVATFDNTSDKDATIDSSFGGSVAGVDINSGYDGTITQARSLTIDSSDFSQDSGTWNSGSQNLIISSNGCCSGGNFTVSGGAFIATTGTWTVERNFTHSGGTLTMTGATITFNDSNSSDDTTLNCSGTLGGTVSVTKTSGGDFTLGSGCSATFSTLSNTNSSCCSNAGNITINGSATGTNISVYNNLTVGSGGSLNFSGSITAGDAGSGHDTTISCSGALGVTVNVSKTSGGDFTLGSGCSATFSTFSNSNSSCCANAGNITINGSATGVNLTVYNNLTIGGSGSLSLSGSVTAGDAGSGHDTTISCSGALGVTVNVSKTSGGDFTLGSGCSATFSTFSVTSSGCCSIAGKVTINGSATGVNLTIYNNLTIGGSGSLSLSGSITAGDAGSGNDTTISCSGTLSPTVNVSKTNGGDFTLGSGCSATFSTFSSTSTGCCSNAGNITINGPATGTNLTFYNNLTIGGSGSLDFSGSITAGASGLSNDSTLTCNGNIIRMEILLLIKVIVGLYSFWHRIVQFPEISQNQWRL